MKFFCGISLQSKSGGGGGIQKSGYDGSQLLSVETGGTGTGVGGTGAGVGGTGVLEEDF